MHAITRHHYGPPENLQLEEIPPPEPGPGELLVRMHAATINRTDCAILTGKPLIMRFFTGLPRPRDPVTGTDFAGVLEAVGSEVSDFQPGDRVWGFDDNGLGSHAEYLCLSTKKAVLPMPEGIAFEQAAASLEGAHYAYNFLNKVDLQPGQRVMLNGATGAIGSAALQMLKYHGLQVTATCRGEHFEQVRTLGADRLIDYTEEDFTLDNDKYDYVFDTVGKSTFGKCRRLLKPKGIYISSELGPGAQNPLLALLTPLLGGRKVVFPVPMDIKGSMRYIAKLIAEEKFRPLMDRTSALKDAAEAFHYVMSGQKVGNVVLKIS